MFQQTRKHDFRTNSKYHYMVKALKYKQNVT